MLELYIFPIILKMIKILELLWGPTVLKNLPKNCLK